MKTPFLLLAALAFVTTATVRCTPGQRATASTVSSAIATAAPVACAGITALAGSGSSVCGPVATDVSDVAKLVQDILASLPPAKPGAAVAGLKQFVYRGVKVTLPADKADQVWAVLVRDGGT